MSEYEFPTLYKVMANGKTRFWTIFILHYDKESHIKTRYGFMNGGKVTETEPTKITQGKNIGRSNETSIREQAFLEAKSKWDIKVKKEQFKESDEKSNEKSNISNVEDTTNKKTSNKDFRPMLANTFEPKKSKFDVSYIAQPKLDGIRMNCIFENEQPKFVTRTGKNIENFEELKKYLVSCNFPKGIILDGEIGCFGKKPVLTFQEVTGIVKRKKGTVNEKEKYITYVVYDLFDPQHPEMSFVERYRLLESIFKTRNKSGLVRLCCDKLIIVQSLNEIEQILTKFLDDGYEGLMLRTQDGKYETDKRSKSLLKYKKFTDSEYEIIGFKEGNGNDKETIIFECKTPQDKKFSVRPAMTRGERSKMYHEAITNPEKYIGKKLTVKYFELSPDGIPRFPVGIAIRDYE